MRIATVNFINADELPAPPEGLTVPSIETRTFMLLDDDAKECRVIEQDELEAAYVDNNISTFRLDDINPLTLDVDQQQLLLTYNSGAETSILLGLVDWDTAIRADQYIKREGLIYPIDESGTLMLNVVNTPNLVNIRKKYHEMATDVSAEHVKYAEIVHAFVEAGFDPVSHLDGIGGGEN